MVSSLTIRFTLHTSCLMLLFCCLNMACYMIVCIIVTLYKQVQMFVFILFFICIHYDKLQYYTIIAISPPPPYSLTPLQYTINIFILYAHPTILLVSRGVESGGGGEKGRRPPIWKVGGRTCVSSHQIIALKIYINYSILSFLYLLVLQYLSE